MTKKESVALAMAGLMAMVDFNLEERIVEIANIIDEIKRG